MAVITILLSSSVSFEESWEIRTYSLQLLQRKTKDGKGWSLVLTVAWQLQMSHEDDRQGRSLCD